MIYALIEIADADILEIYILHALFTKNTFLYFLQFTAHHFSQFKSQCVLYLLLQHIKLSFIMSSFMPIANKETDFKCIIAQLALILVKALSAVLPSRIALQPWPYHSNGSIGLPQRIRWHEMEKDHFIFCIWLIWNLITVQIYR